MTRLLFFVILTFSWGAAAQAERAAHTCEIVPKTSARYPLTEVRSTGVSLEAFQTVLRSVERVYGPVIRAHGRHLKIAADWANPEVNAFAEQSKDGKIWTIHAYGGLARHPLMTPDAFLLVACHEIGHHLGGAPYYSGNPLSSEGQADYFAALKCMRKTLPLVGKPPSLETLLRKMPMRVERACDEAVRRSEEKTPAAFMICLRTHLAAQSLGEAFTDLDNGERRARQQPLLPMPDIAYFDRNVAKRTLLNKYPTQQCRLDTYVAGALCPVPVHTPLSVGHPNTGVCVKPEIQSAATKLLAGSRVFEMGARPSCWYNQNEMLHYQRRP